jgi:hypothetical protein
VALVLLLGLQQRQMDLLLPQLLLRMGLRHWPCPLVLLLLLWLRLLLLLLLLLPPLLLRLWL